MKLIIQSKKDYTENINELISLLKEKVGADSEIVFIKPKDNSYKIEEIRNFVSKLNNKQTNLTDNLFYILLEGDTLSPICQNALLKTLEESSYSIGILVKNIDVLLQTIKSRCQIIKLNEEPVHKNSVDIEYNKLTKAERSEVVKALEDQLDNLKQENIYNAIFLQDAINKLDANCKIESVLIELESKLKSI